MSFLKRRKSDYEDFIQLQQTMAQKLSKKDKSYSYYVGADLENALEMAFIDVLLKEELINNKIANIYLKLYRLFCEQKRKAFFEITVSEFSKLGLLLGETRRFKDATKTTIRKE